MFENSTLADLALGRSAIRRRILTLLAGTPGERLHLREIQRRALTSPGTASRELARLVASGLVEREAEGNQVYFRASSSPLAAALYALLPGSGTGPAATVTGTGRPFVQAPLHGATTTNHRPVHSVEPVESDGAAGNRPGGSATVRSEAIPGVVPTSSPRIPGPVAAEEPVVVGQASALDTDAAGRGPASPRPEGPGGLASRRGAPGGTDRRPPPGDGKAVEPPPASPVAGKPGAVAASPEVCLEAAGRMAVELRSVYGDRLRALYLRQGVALRAAAADQADDAPDLSLWGPGAFDEQRPGRIHFDARLSSPVPGRLEFIVVLDHVTSYGEELDTTGPGFAALGLELGIRAGRIFVDEADWLAIPPAIPGRTLDEALEL